MLRRLMIRIRPGVFALLPFPFFAISQAPSEIAGVVFEDRNGNGTEDADEPGLPGMVVSNQIDVVATDGEGRFTLPGPGTGVVWVRVPAQHRAPRGFWRKGTSGSPVSFPLTRAAAAEDFTFLHASDTHVSEASLPRIEKLRAVVARMKPAFVLITGDLVRDALRVGESEAKGYYKLYQTAASGLGAPVWNVPGNHEIFGIERHRSLVSAEHPLYGRKMYRDLLGPDYYSFDYGRVHFVGLNSVDFDDLSYYGHVDEVQLRWLERDLERVEAGATVVTFQHIPFFSAAPIVSGYDGRQRGADPDPRAREDPLPARGLERARGPRSLALSPAHSRPRRPLPRVGEAHARDADPVLPDRRGGRTERVRNEVGIGGYPLPRAWSRHR